MALLYEYISHYLVGESVAVNLPAGLTLRSAIAVIAESDDVAAVITDSCTDEYMSLMIREGVLRAGNTASLIEGLQYRTTETSSVSVLATLDSKKGIYEVSCSN